MCENKILIKLCVAPKLIYTDWFPSMLQLLDVNKYFIRNYPQRDLWKHRKEQYLFTTLKKYSFSNFMPAVKKLSANNFFVELSGEDYCSIVRLNKHCIISLFHMKPISKTKTLSFLILKKAFRCMLPIQLISAITANF